MSGEYDVSVKLFQKGTTTLPWLKQGDEQEHTKPIPFLYDKNEIRQQNWQAYCKKKLS